MIDYKLQKFSVDDDVSVFGAFPSGTKLRFRLTVSRQYGTHDITMHVANDSNGAVFTVPFEFVDLSNGCDIYEASVDFNEPSLYFYSIAFSGEHDSSRQLTIYDKDFSTPDTLKGGIMYQIFVDRFARSRKYRPKPRNGAELNSDWYNGVPKFADKPGDPLNANDFFGGNLYGVIEKLDYLQSLGVTCIYLNPIFEAHSNHKYDTGDYMTVDSMFGGDKAFSLLMKETKERSISVILDGVFSHTGDDSKYFNRYGSYRCKGAYQSKKSPYYNWYKFKNYPDDYECWWGVKILPCVDKSSPAYRNYINGENGVVRHYLRQGIAGWRLDVADELSDEFIFELRSSAKTENPEAVIIGEVWEDASNKVAYDRRRKYFLGNELDSVMNYPLRDAVIHFVMTGEAEQFAKTVAELYEHYPKCVSDTLMNILGTHDTERILTVLGGKPSGGCTNMQLSKAKMTSDEYSTGVKRLKLASLLLYMLPGIPCIYYGDEAGMEGYRDPFNRRCFPWENENTELLDWYKKLGCIHKSCTELSEGILRFVYSADGNVVFKRDELIIAVNCSDTPFEIDLSQGGYDFIRCDDVDDRITVEPYKSAVIRPSVKI